VVATAYPESNPEQNCARLLEKPDLIPFMKHLSQLLTLFLLSGALLPFSASAISQKATYTGLFFEPEGVWQQSAGTFSLAITTGSKFSGKLQIGLHRYPFSSSLDANGHATIGILRRFDDPLYIEFQISSEDPDLIQGTVSSGGWTADLIADRAVFDGKRSVSPDAGQYTMIIPGNFEFTADPGGDSFGSITIDKAGRLRFSGSLADGTKVSQSATVSKGGQWPLYLSLYREGGALWAWMLFYKTPEEPLTGDVTWIRPEMIWTSFYPAGFAITSSAWGSYYQRPLKGERIIGISDGILEFNGGNLEHGITNQVVLDSKNRPVNLSPNGLTMKFNTSNGTFTGKVQHPISWEWIRFQGVALQDYGVAAGYFLDWTKSGEVWLQAPIDQGPPGLLRARSH
jgi:hypothetical protein